MEPVGLTGGSFITNDAAKGDLLREFTESSRDNRCFAKAGDKFHARCVRMLHRSGLSSWEYARTLAVALVAPPLLVGRRESWKKGPAQTSTLQHERREMI
jgi:hypothetical protein